jgi:hypothetical protein
VIEEIVAVGVASAVSVACVRSWIAGRARFSGRPVAIGIGSAVLTTGAATVSGVIARSLAADDWALVTSIGLPAAATTTVLLVTYISANRALREQLSESE